MSEDLHSLAVKWEFTTEANIEQLIEELAGVLKTYASLVGFSGVPDELARLLELAQGRKREVASAIENLSPLAQSLLNYPTPMPPLWKMSLARLSDEIISRLLKSVRLAQHLDRARKDLVEKGFLEVKDDIYTLKIHDAGQTGHDPDS